MAIGGKRQASSSSFDDFVTARSHSLLRTAYLLTRDRGLAEDLVQTALTKAYLAWGRIDENPEPYVRRILVNTYASWWRRKWQGERPTGKLPDRALPDDRVDESRDLWDALARLPRRQRAVIVLRYFEDLTAAQTADLLGITVGTVKSQSSKALAALRIDPSLVDDRGEVR